MKSQRLNRYKGTASEHFACADIWLQGYKAYLIPSDVFDLILKAENHLFKLQVKSSSFSTNKNSSVSFNLTRGCNSKGKYNKEDIDGWIFVNLINKKVCYYDILELNNKWKKTVSLEDFEKHTLERFLKKKGI